MSELDKHQVNLELLVCEQELKNIAVLFGMFT
jgi:hypothetical protein